VRISWKPLKQRYGGELQDLVEETGRLRVQLSQTAAILSPPPRTAPVADESRGGRPAPGMIGVGAQPVAVAAPREALKEGKDARRPTGSAPGGKDGDGDAFLAAVDALKETRRGVLAAHRERTAIKQSLHELDDQVPHCV
jgi:hypothetical protein